MKRKLKIAAIAVASGLALIVSFLAWVIYTEAGLRFVVNSLPEKIGKSQVVLRIANIRGTIAGGFSAERVDVIHEVSTVVISNGRARVNFWPLLVGRISVDEWRKRAEDGPCLVVDLDVVRENYQTFAKALPDTRVFYAVKANPCSASAPRARPPAGSWSPLPTGGAWSSPTCAPRASLATRPSGSSKATSSTGC